MNTHQNDKIIFTLSQKIEKNFLDSINPINSNKEKENFFNEYKKYHQYNPQFNYTKKINYTKEEKELIELKKTLKQNLIEKLFAKKIESLLKEINLLNNVNTKKFCNNSIKFFGKPHSTEIKLAEEIIQKKEKKLKTNITPIQLKEKIQPLLTKTGFSAELKQQMSSKASVNLTKKKLFINSNSTFNKNDLNRFKIHEIETHIYRYLNGLNQPYKILSIGTGGEYLKTEEGLAIYNETTIQNNPYQEKIIAARLYATNYALKHDFFDTFDELNKYFNKEEAYTITQRVKRGIPCGERGAFTKDYCYFSGYLKIKNYVEQQRELKNLYYGKISAEEIKIIKRIKNLNEPKYLPKHYTRK